MNKTGTPFYLKDLSSDIRISIENLIRINRKDLIEDLDNNKDITIGYFLKEDEYNTN